MLLDVSKNINFVDRALFQLFVLLKSPYFNHFYCILPCIELVSGSVDLSVGALTDNFIECVVFDDSYHLKIKKVKNNFQTKNYNKLINNYNISIKYFTKYG